MNGPADSDIPSVPALRDEPALPVARQAERELATLQSSLLASLGLRLRHRLHRLGGHSEEILGMALSPDGQLLATGGRDRIICLWDYAQGRSVARLTGHRDWVWWVAFSPDGRQLASAARDGEVALWDAASGARLACAQAHRGAAYALVFVGELLITTGEDGHLAAWDARGLERRWTVQAHRAPCRSVALRGEELLTAGEDGRLSRWEAATGRELGAVEVGRPLCAGRADAAGAAVGGADGFLALVDPTSGAVLRRFEGHGGRVRNLSLAGGLLYSGADDGIDCVWALSSGELRQCFGNPSSSVNGVRFAPDGNLWFASGGRLGCLDPASGRTLHNVAGFGESCMGVALATNADRLVAADWGGAVCAVERSSGRVLFSPTPLPARLRSLAIAPDGSRYAAGDWNGYLELRSLPGNAPLARFRAHAGSVQALVFSVDGRTLFSGHRGSQDNLRAWDVETLLRSPPTGDDEEWSLRGLRSHPAFRFGTNAHDDTLFCLDLSRDGRLLATGAGDRTACLWDVERALSDRQVAATRTLGKPLRRLAATSWVRSVRISPDGSQLVTGEEDGRVRLFDAASGRQLRCFEGTEHVVTSVDFHPDRPEVVAGSWDRRLRHWDTRTGELLRTWEPVGKAVTGSFRAVLADPGGGALLSGGVREVQCFRPGEYTPFRVFDTESQVLCSLLAVGEALLLGCRGRVLELDLSTGRARTLIRGSLGRYRNLALDATGSRLAVVEGDDPEPSLFTVFGLAEGREVRYCQSPSGPSSFAFVEGALLVGRHDGAIDPWAFGSGFDQTIWNGHRGPVRAMGVEPMLKQVVSGGEDGELRLWSRRGRCLRVLTGHTGPVTRLVMQAEEVWSGSADGTVRVWDLARGRCVQVLEAGSPVRSMALSPDGEQLACGLTDGRLVIWGTSRRELRCARQLEADEVAGLAWTATHLVCACGSGALVFLGSRDLEHLATFHALERGLLWTTPPDAAAPNGWLWTDRPELVDVVECDEGGANPRALGSDAASRAEHLKLYNDSRMVLLRLNSPEEYRRQVLGQRALADRSRPALPEPGRAR